MSLSLLQFVKEFEKLQSTLKQVLSAEYKLSRLLDFQEIIEPHLNNKTYHSYIAIYKQDVDKQITEENLHDLTFDELQALFKLGQALKLEDKYKCIIKRTVTLLCYVGDYQKVIAFYNSHTDETLDPAMFDFNETLSSPFETITVICDSLSKSLPEAYEFFSAIKTEWETKCDALSNRHVNCILVEKYKETQRGKLCQLECEVEVLSKRVSEDKISLDDKMRSSDDPFGQVLYNSIAVVKPMVSWLMGDKPKYLHVHLNISNNDHAVTGDSVGLASAAIMYANLIKDEVQRYEKFLSGEVAITGAIDEHGNVLPVSNDSLPYKIERLFFSHVNYIVIPESNYNKAKQTVQTLNTAYPHRKLMLLPVENYSDLLRNKNIIRSEKVCIGEYAVKKVYKYTRMTKVQVPLLGILIWLLLAILSPKYFDPWFDWNPKNVVISGNGFAALNTDSIPLWSVEYECGDIDSTSPYIICNLDSDNENEIVFSPSTPHTTPCEDRAFLYAYDHNGAMLWKRHCVTYGAYPGDSVLDLRYQVDCIGVAGTGESTAIVTTVHRSYPSRTHIKIWNAKGDSLGWYINAGSIIADDRFFSSEWEIGYIFAGINRRLKSACLFVLPRESGFGASPPYTDAELRLDLVPRGNQFHYVVFPPSDLNKSYNHLYNGTQNFSVESDNLIEVRVDEALVKNPERSLSYFVDKRFRVTKVNAGDNFIQNREKLVSDGVLSPIDWKTYLKELRDSVMYYTDSGWVTEGELQATGQ